MGDLETEIGSEEATGHSRTNIECANHHVRRCGHRVASRFTGQDKAKDVRELGSLPVGKIITLIGVDGCGKSTQVELLASLLRSDFRTKVLYFGMNINRLTRWRRYLARFGLKKVMNGNPRKNSSPRPTRRQSAGPFWRVFGAAVRWINVKRANRLRRKGVLVICDRWPQNLEAGCLDGPSAIPASAGILTRLLNWFERRLHRSMAAVSPDMIAHLIIDFERSAARKQGDLNRAEFSKREELMCRMRAIDPTIVSVDAGKPADEVTSQLLNMVWDCLQSPRQVSSDGAVTTNALASKAKK